MSTDSLPNLHQLDARRGQGSDPIVIDGISYIPSSALLTGTPKISFKDNRCFAVVNSHGESPRLYAHQSELGFYCDDTRFLGVWETTFNGNSPVSLAQELRFDGNTCVFSMTNKDFPELNGEGRIPRDTCLIRKIMTLRQDRLYETIEIKNFNDRDVDLQIEQWAGGRFEDVFEVRGFPRARRGRMLPPQEIQTEDGFVSVIQYEGLDGRVRRTSIRRFFPAEKIRLSPGLIGHFTRIRVPAKRTVSIRTVIAFDRDADTDFFGRPFAEVSVGEQMRILAGQAAEGPFSKLHIETDSAIINRAVENARLDIGMLLAREPDGVLYPDAGVPWFAAPFGRDGIITAYQLLPWHPILARGVLEYVFATMGRRDDPFTEEQPGKIFHEKRRGEMSATREVPFIPYYGSVDATPLALILFHEYYRWTKDLDFLRKYWPDAMRCLECLDRGAAANRDGFLEYDKHSLNGLVNQGWKDSHNSIMHADGRLASPPISLCEVQGYAFRARMGLSALAQARGDLPLSRRLRLEALQLRSRFVERFWDSARSYVYLALDGDARPCSVLSSNMGHCLWAQLLTAEQARPVISHLMSDAMFSGYGLRTLASTEVAYNPLSYHNGSVWPHDNSIIMEGLRNYGALPELERLAGGLIGVLESSEDFRLPELFCGFRRRGDFPPIPYEVACKPQAWAAGSVFLMLKSLLGVGMDTDQSHLIFRSPRLTDKIGWLEIRNLCGPGWEIDLVVRRSAGRNSVEVTRRSGSVRVMQVDKKT